MQTLIRAAVVLAFAGTLFACKPKPEPAPVAEAEPAEEAQTESAENLIEACTISMTEPESMRWTTYWDTEQLVNMAESPSSARSAYWANEEERKTLTQTNAVEPLVIRCSSNDSPAISLSFSSYTSPLKTVPQGSGEYEIVGGADGDPPPGKFRGGPIVYDQRTIEPTSGSLTIDRFDMDGVRGSFRLDAKESGEGGAEFRFEGTFDIPCVGGALESACESNKAVKPEGQ